MNAYQLAPNVRRFFGVDVSGDSLKECSRQISELGLNNFVGVKIDADNPEAAIEQIDSPADIFLCTYIIELLPSP